MDDILFPLRPRLMYDVPGALVCRHKLRPLAERFFVVPEEQPDFTMS